MGGKNHHPTRRCPPLYADQGLFEDARRLRVRMGDEAFFAELNGGVQQAASGWGKLARDAQRGTRRASRRPLLDAYVGEDDRDAQSPRAKLFSDLVRTFFTVVDRAAERASSTSTPGSAS